MARMGENMTVSKYDASPQLSFMTFIPCQTHVQWDYKLLYDGLMTFLYHVTPEAKASVVLYPLNTLTHILQHFLGYDGGNLLRSFSTSLFLCHPPTNTHTRL